MFTGIIEEVGRVKRVVRKGKGIVLTVEASRVMEEVKIGESIAVDGACLTIIEKGKGSFQVEVSPVTLKSTTFSSIEAGDRVNLERPLSLASRLGGHIITGHVDGKGKIVEKGRGKEFDLRISYPLSFSHYLIKRGSVAVDGVSLTVQELDGSTFETYIISHTSSNTTLGEKKVGDEVNLEFDFLIKLFHKWWKEKKGKDNLLSLLETTGFLKT